MGFHIVVLLYDFVTRSGATLGVIKQGARALFQFSSCHSGRETLSISRYTNPPEMCGSSGDPIRSHLVSFKFQYKRAEREGFVGVKAETTSLHSVAHGAARDL